MNRTLKNVFKILAVFFIATVGGIFADQILWPYFVERPLFYQYNLERPPIFVTEKKEIVIQENQALQRAVEKTEKIVFTVNSQLATGKTISGSGFFLTADGLAVTLASLVPSGAKFSFSWQGEKLGFEIIKRDQKLDLALIKLQKSNLPTSSFDSSVALGERVFFVAAFLEKNLFQKAVNEGIIKTFNSQLLQTNIQENLAVAGSPLFDIEGNILGIISVDKQGFVSALPIALVRTFAAL